MTPPFPVDFNRAPFLVIWETTRACALACVHCRADAIPRRDPRELTRDEAFGLIDQLGAFAPAHPLFVLTGGDPMRRPDLADIVRYAHDAGLTVALTPSGTAAATRKRLVELKAAGLSRIAVSLDGPDPAAHDAFRRVRGSYAWTMKIIEAAIELDLPLQINTTVSRLTLPHLDAMANLVADLPLALWAIFFLVQTGRGASLDQVTADECERVLHDLYDLSLSAPFGIKTTEAPHYQRVVWQREHARLQAGLATHAAERRRQLRAPRSVGDGNGFVFIDHLGNICPSGFLPVRCGNVRTASLADVYRTHDVFTRLRDAGALRGKCGRCRFREICGGSRSRAYAATGALTASDPLCVYEPGSAVQPAVSATVQLVATAP
ncbi:MAG TPA: TIGR04053 family radical SAM/SPASM domain-containing protein [Vicinamibacterales bacterium]|nr:TIGR04053 family radical SAM/SPASM domain-containing protein [Vicinamibacterales bacterium]